MDERPVPLNTTTNRHPRTIEHDTTINGTTRHQVHRGEAAIGRGTAYDSRVYPKSSKRTPDKNQNLDSASSVSTSTSSKAVKEQELRSTKYKTSPYAQRTQRKQERQPSRTRVPKKLSITIRRSPSERAALKKFTLELERHLQATRKLPPKSSSAKGLSTHTIEEFLPYKAQLNAAGLAVTSREQRRKGSRLYNRGALPKPTTTGEPPGPVSLTLDPLRTSAKPAPDRRYHSTSTGSTVLGFTPPHEESSNRARGWRPSTSSDHTIIGFTPPHETQLAASHATPVKSTRNSLPWLRKQRQADKTSHEADKIIQKAPSPENHARGSQVVTVSNPATLRSMEKKEHHQDAALRGPSSHTRLRRLPESDCVPPSTKAQLTECASHDTLADSIDRNTEVSESVVPEQSDDGEDRPDVASTAPFDTAVDPGPRESADTTLQNDMKDRTSAIQFVYPQYTDRPQHICVDISCLVCQQCNPSPPSSGALSPLQISRSESSLPEVITASEIGADVKSVKTPFKRKVPSRTNVRMHSSTSKASLSPRMKIRSGNSMASLRSRVRVRSSDDKSVFRGLHVATAAACDDDIDTWIEDVTGLGVRKFLASLSQFSGLGVTAPADVARRAAQHREEEVEAWETIRRYRSTDAKGVPVKKLQPS